MDTKVRCPHCGDYVEPASAGAPFFCSSCHQVIDPSPRRAGVSAAPDSPETEPPAPAPHGIPQSAPGHGLATGQTLALGYLLAAMVAGGAAYGLAWLSTEKLYLPLVWFGIAGWLTYRALAAGSGGGTPDRSVLGSVAIIAIGIGVLGLFTWVDYLATRARERPHWETVFGPRGTESARHFVGRLKDRDTDHDDLVRLAEDETTVRVSEEEERAMRAIATRVTTHDSFDVPLLASTQRKGFEGFVRWRMEEGRTVRITPEHRGWKLGGGATVGLAAVELLTFLLFAFHRRD